MIRVFVWPFRGKDVAWGHASLEVGGGHPAGTIYISWWPEGANRRVKRFNGRAIDGSLYCVGSIPNRKFSDDVTDEEGPPTHKIELAGKTATEAGLDETAIKAWWKKLINSGSTDWCTLGPNCSTITAYALQVGGGDESSNMWNNTNVVWSPNAVFDYAIDIRDGIRYERLPRSSVSDLDGGLPPGGVP